MTTLTARETARYTDALRLPHYADHSPGEHYADLFASLVPPGSYVLDAGTGTGKGFLALKARGFAVVGCDLTTDGLVPEMRGLDEKVWSGVCLWKPWPPELAHVRIDYAYCTDVLEHIPPSFTMLVVRNLLDIAPKGVFLSLSLVPDVMGAWVGEPLHLSVRSFGEWLDDFRELATVTDARDLGHAATYLLVRR